MNMCKTCRFWNRSDGYETGDQVLRPFHPVTFDMMTDADMLAEHGHEAKYCTHPKILFYEYPSKSGAAVVDGSQYRAALITAEEFGCVLHEENK